MSGAEVGLERRDVARTIAVEVSDIKRRIRAEKTSRDGSLQNERRVRVRQCATASEIDDDASIAAMGARIIEDDVVVAVMIQIGESKMLVVVISLERRCILHVNVTAHPNAEWTAQQMVEAVGYERFETLIRDRDGIYGAAFDRRSRRCKTSTALNPVRAASGSDVASFRSPIMEAMRIWCTKQAAFGLAESMSRPCKPSATDARWVQLLRRPHVRGLSHG